MRIIADIDDFKLLRCFVETNSQEAFGQLVNRHINLVYAVCLRETNDPVLAQDVTQAVFLTLFHKAPGIQKGTVLTGWLFNTSRFAAKNAMRQEIRRKVMEQELMEAMSQNAGPSDTWQTIEPLLHEAIASLKAKEREAILLRYFEERSLKEVGLKLNTTENAAQMRVSRALEKLKQFLQKNGVVVPLAILSALLSEHAVPAAPASCAQAVVGLLSGLKVGSTAVGSAVTAHKAYGISQGVIKSMFINKLKVASMVVTLSVAGGIGAVYLSHLVPLRAAETAVKTGHTQQVTKSAALDSDTPLPTGSAILQNSKAAYAALSTYVGKTSVHGVAVINGRNMESNATANIQFRRPNFLHIEGLQTESGTYEITCDGSTAKLETVYNGESSVFEESSPEMVVAAATGIAGAAPTLIPAVLLDFKQISTFQNIADASLDGQETVNGAPCYKVSITIPHDKQTFWVDKKSALLRRYSEERDQIDLQKEAEAHGKASPERSHVPKSFSYTAVHEFTIESTS